MAFQWNQLDEQAVATAKLLAADAVENAGSGHPGTPISLAAAAYLLYQRHLRFDPADPQWLGRDRFVLSAGHASMLQYAQLYLAGAGLELEDLRAFRKFGSLTPGHPERGHTPGVELTTGPLGSGLASAVGMAMASRREHGLFDPDAPLGESVFDHFIYVFAGDGCLQEGITAEACSLAGTQNLGNLVVIYDDNHISIEDDTQIAFTEDVVARFESYGWHTERVNWLAEDGSYREDVEALNRALTAAQATKNQPSLIALRTIIGWPTPGKQNTGSIHGAKLGSEAMVGLKEALGADPQQMFAVDEQVVEYTRQNAATRGQAARYAWEEDFRAWRQEHPQQAALLERLQAGDLPPEVDDALPVFEAGASLATRAASGQVLNTLAPVMPELWGGSADLAGSNNTLLKGEASFLPPERSSAMFQGHEFGRNLHFGVREHAMGAIMNGIACSGLTSVYGGTFFVFSDYMRGAVRLAALMQLPVTYVWTHDSIGVGEDGPTHQPVEHLAAYRAIPGLSVVRPADANETAHAWKTVLARKAPAALVLTRQNLPVFERGGASGLAAAANVERGAYVLADAPATVGGSSGTADPTSLPEVILLASGSEVQLALQAREVLAGEGVAARVVSVPCLEWFEEQDTAYQESVLPAAVRARVSVEAGLALPWHRFVGDVGECVSIESFGQPGAAGELFAEYGITVEAVVAAAKKSLQQATSLK